MLDERINLRNKLWQDIEWYYAQYLKSDTNEFRDIYFDMLSRMERYMNNIGFKLEFTESGRLNSVPAPTTHIVKLFSTHRKEVTTPDRDYTDSRYKEFLDVFESMKNRIIRGELDGFQYNFSPMHMVDQPNNLGRFTVERDGKMYINLNWKSKLLLREFPKYTRLEILYRRAKQIFARHEKVGHITVIDRCNLFKGNIRFINGVRIELTQVEAQQVLTQNPRLVPVVARPVGETIFFHLTATSLETVLASLQRKGEDIGNGRLQVKQPVLNQCLAYPIVNLRDKLGRQLRYYEEQTFMINSLAELLGVEDPEGVWNFSAARVKELIDRLQYVP